MNDQSSELTHVPNEAERQRSHTRPPFATYRLQFNPDFRFKDAEALVPYLHRLGVTHIYGSPILQPRRGSEHGYDVIDPTAINPELGTEEEFRSLVATLHAHDMGLMIDIVPNHMAAVSANRYWDDVLTFGPSSPYARWFDIDWRLPDPELWGRVVVPALGRPLRKAIETEEISLVWEDGRFRVRYYEQSFPVDPGTVPEILKFGGNSLRERLGADHPVVQELSRCQSLLRALPKPANRMRQRIRISMGEARAAIDCLQQLAEDAPEIREWLQQTASEFGRGTKGHRRLRRLLGAQSYRLAYWRRAARVLNYRRFFDINDLIALRQEDPEVFDQTHSLVIRFAKEDLIDGLRIDHVDGLRDPLAYFQRLSEAVRHPEMGQPERRTPIFVEKILAYEEHLPESWPVAGSTGYEFLNQVEAIFLSPEGTAEIEQTYRQILRRPVRFSKVAAWGKRRVLKAELSAFVGRLADSLMLIARHTPESPDFSKREFVDAIIETVAGLPVYRTYVSPLDPELSEQDRAYLETALEEARQRERAMPAAIDFLEDVLLLKNQGDLPQNVQQERLNFIQRFQQLTGPATAKGIEDTALYAFVPLVSRNEVGGEPDAPLENAVSHLHGANHSRAASWPHNMLSATTHDTKRSADVRSRLDVLSELPKLWEAYVQRWRRWNAPHRKRIKGQLMPDSNMEYLFYQSLVGIWPLGVVEPSETNFPDTETINELRERLEQYMIKAAREAKLRTSWVDQNSAYEEALIAFIRSLFWPTDEQSENFLKDVHHLVLRIGRPGFWNALSRCLIQLTAPGTPDTYQGDELWNLALVDPDNRRPVDFSRRQQWLVEIEERFVRSQPEQRQAYLAELLRTPEDGRVKLHVVRTALETRRRHPQLFAAGNYTPLDVHGSGQQHVFAFARVAGNEALITIVPRLVATLIEDASQPPIGPDTWTDTTIRLPEWLHDRRWISETSGETVTPAVVQGRAQLSVADVLRTFPVGLLSASPGQ